jgi:hypothetical protein
MVKFSEGELEFNFPENLNWFKFDPQGKTLPQDMRFVDLVIETQDETILLEIKDPSDTKATELDRNKFLADIKTKALIPALVSKVRGAYTYQHLMAQDSKPFKYIVLIALESFEEDLGLELVNLTDRLFRRIRKESYEPWKREYVKSCIVMSLDTWNQEFASWSVARVPTTEARG